MLAAVIYCPQQATCSSYLRLGLPVVVVVVVVVVLPLTRIIKSVVTGQAPVTREWRNTPRKKTRTKPKVVHAYIIADATQACARKI